MQWSFYSGDETDQKRYRYENGALVLKAKGSGPADSSPLWFVTGDGTLLSGREQTTILLRSKRTHRILGRSDFQALIRIP